LEPKAEQLPDPHTTAVVLTSNLSKQSARQSRGVSRDTRTAPRRAPRPRLQQRAGHVHTRAAHARSKALIARCCPRAPPETRVRAPAPLPPASQLWHRSLPQPPAALGSRPLALRGRGRRGRFAFKATSAVHRSRC